MKRINPRSSMALFLVATLFAGTVPVMATPVTYEHFYDADALPEDVATDPQWGQINTNGDSSVTGGVLTVTTASGPPNTNEAWRIGVAGATTYGDGAAGWSATPATGSTIDFRARVTEPDSAARKALQISVADGDKSVSFFIGKFAITAIGDAVSTISHNNTEYQTFRIAFQNGSANLYVDDSATAIFSNVLGSTSTVNALTFGEGSAGEYGSFDLDLIYWTNAEANFSAPPTLPIPEPATLYLIAIGLSLAVSRPSHSRR